MRKRTFFVQSVIFVSGLTVATPAFGVGSKFPLRIREAMQSFQVSQVSCDQVLYGRRVYPQAIVDYCLQLRDREEQEREQQRIQQQEQERERQRIQQQEQEREQQRIQQQEQERERQRIQQQEREKEQQRIQQEQRDRERQTSAGPIAGGLLLLILVGILTLGIMRQSIRRNTVKATETQVQTEADLTVSMRDAYSLERAESIISAAGSKSGSSLTISLTPHSDPGSQIIVAP